MELDSIGDFFKDSIKNVSSENLVQSVKSHYIKMTLFNEKWSLKELEEHSKTLLPDKMNSSTFDPFVDATMQGVMDNSYLLDIIKSIDIADFKDLHEKTKDSEIIISLMTFAWALEQLTIITRNDYRVIMAIQNYWVKTRKSSGIWQHFNLFEKAKITTLEKGNIKKFSFLKSNDVPPFFGKIFLRINILEAIIEDIRLGFRSNALSGIPLMVNTSDGLTSISPDKNIVVYSTPLTEKWNDLYTTWNLGFMSHYENFPFFFIKLLIPQVNQYKNNPKQYLANRSNALYMCSHYVGFERKAIAEGKSNKLEWNNDKFSDLLGKKNKKYALEFSKMIVEKQSSSFSNFWLFIQKLFS